MSKFWQKKYISKYTGAEIDAAVGNVPVVTSADAGKALVVDEEGKIVAGEAGGEKIVGTVTITGYEFIDHAIPAGSLISFFTPIAENVASQSCILIANETVNITETGDNIIPVSVINQSRFLNTTSALMDWTGGTKPVTAISGGIEMAGWDGDYFLNNGFNITVNFGH